MNTIDIKYPIFKVIIEKNGLHLDKATQHACRDNWYPVGGVGRRGNDWVQVMIKEGPSPMIIKYPEFTQEDIDAMKSEPGDVVATGEGENADVEF